MGWESARPPYNAPATRKDRALRVAEGHEVIEAVFVEMDHPQEGCCGVLVELVATREGNAAAKTARSRLIESARARHFNHSWGSRAAWQPRAPKPSRGGPCVLAPLRSHLAIFILSARTREGDFYRARLPSPKRRGKSLEEGRMLAVIRVRLLIALVVCPRSPPCSPSPPFRLPRRLTIRGMATIGRARVIRSPSCWATT